MNSTSFFDQLQDIQYAYNFTSFLMLLPIPCFLIVNVLITPFYMFVYKQNIKRDEKMPIFPLMNHFYKMTRTTTVIILFIILGLFMCFFTQSKNRIFALASLFPVLLLMESLVILTQVYHWLIFLLAAERAIIYFFPSSEKRVLSILKSIHANIHYIYIYHLLIILMLKIGFRRGRMFKNAYWYNPELLFWSWHMLGYILLIISALLYLPIMISVRKLSHLASAQENKPQKYIFWQTMIVVIFQLISLVQSLTLVLINKETEEIDMVLLTFTMMIMDTAYAPLIIQTCYLGCNKRNVKMLVTSRNLKKLVIVVCDSNDSAVHATVCNSYFHYVICISDWPSGKHLKSRKPDLKREFY
ncbi:Serpentine Receptor, class Z [Caenorhabditis elegans]|uniref:Serpentine Receptor, class Z n=1 Tax=Caenorhabditis elegans TaxID=6239 RepID=Q9N5W5_CAEEL|nr:Serpentine Receptor, class Z [Caenorhabditis elegans]CCD67048.1 Serpentine Receptor, class Z [Caenorhabditis elegans]|eukprot:NP_497520.2 Serpentine Receptor, class Z [Caenorhabditis elegans]